MNHHPRRRRARRSEPASPPPTALPTLRCGSGPRRAGRHVGLRIRFLLTALAVFALAACGGKFSGGNAEAYGTFRIDVTNDRAPRVEVALVPEGGEAVALGNAPVEGTTTFRVEPRAPEATHRLRATLMGGRELTSEPFVPAEIRGVTWVLGSNTLTPQEDGG